VLALYIVSTLLFVYVSLRQQLDERLRAEFERVEDRLAEASGGTINIDGHDEEGEPASLVEVWSPEGAVLFRSASLRGEALAPAPPTTTRDDWSFTSLRLRDGTPLRVLSRAYGVLGRRVVVRVAASEERLRHEWRELSLGLLFGLPVAVAIAGLGGHWLARGVLAPLGRMARRAERLTADNLGERLPVENADDELGQLARVFNASLARIEESFAQLRRFTADASHELRTPLTVIRAVGEVALQDHQDPERYREAIGSMLEEVDRLSRLVASLLFLSRAEAGPVLRCVKLGLLELARETAALLEILAEEKGQRIEVGGDDAVMAEVDGLILRQAVINLIDNAIKYSPRGGCIRITVRTNPEGAAIVEVADEGPGIPEGHRSRVFDRFYRVDKSRSREGGGAGLGLAIALWAVKAHGGRIELESEEGRGSTFRIVLLALSSSTQSMQHERPKERGEVMRTVVILAGLLGFIAADVRAQAPSPAGLDTSRIETLTGAKGALDEKEGVFKVSVPRADLTVTAAGVRMTPPLGLTSWAAFKRAGGHVMVMGDLVLLEDQVNPVMSVALDQGLEVTALHNHFFWDTPKVMFMHVGGSGEEAAMASAVGNVLAKIKDTAGGKGDVPHAEIDPAQTTLDTSKIEAILGNKGSLGSGVYKVTIGRTARMHGQEVAATMGVNTWAAFAGSDQRAVVDGDFAMLESELQNVLKALRHAGINVVAIHQHMAGEEPRIVFLHYWGVGSTDVLARGLRAALDQTRHEGDRAR
jgi:heavy metal sensor kinase